METAAKTDKCIEIEKIKKQLHITASQPPRFDPFTFEGREQWDTWAESCRSLEGQLIELGVNL